MSALLEVGDEQFEAARAAGSRLQANYDSRTQAGDLELPLDVAAARSYLSDNELIDRLAALAEETGFTLWPDADEQDLAELIEASNVAGYRSMADLDAFFKATEPKFKSVLEAMLKASEDHPDVAWIVSVPFLAASLVWIDASKDEPAVLDSINRAADFYIDALRAGRSALRRGNASL